MGFFGSSIFGSPKQQTSYTYTSNLADSGNLAISKTSTWENVGNSMVSVNVPTPQLGSDGLTRSPNLILVGAIGLMIVGTILYNRS